MEIEGKRIFITGANRGLGRALALACARAGAGEVVAAARRTEQLQDLLACDDALAERIKLARLDVTSDEDARAAAAERRVDILINNAGIACYGGALKTSLKEIRNEIEINYIGILRVARTFAPAMIERGDGLIVNIASVLGKISVPMLGTYCATKAAMLSLSQAMRGDLSDTGVRVIAVLPSTLDTDMSRNYKGPKLPPDQAAEEILEAIRIEANETPIGDEARKILAGLAADPAGMEQAFGKYRA